MKDFKELEVWKETRKLVNAIYSSSKAFPKEEQYGIVQQMRRASVSVLSNLSEVVGRQYKKETLQFLFIAKSSLYELEAQLIISFDQHFINETFFQELNENVILSIKLINGLINYYQNTELK